MRQTRWDQYKRKWTKEIHDFVEARCPLREHGYQNRQELLDDIEEVFGVRFTVGSLATHCGDTGVVLGLCNSNSKLPRGEKHWRHRPVGSFQEKKGYKRIKVAEPNEWMQYQRYVWEQHHPGQSAKGMSVIFLDGDTHNYDPDNLERVTRGELSVMSELGNRKDMTKEERLALLAIARIKIAENKLLGKRAQAYRQHQNYERRKNSPEYKEQARKNHEKWLEKYRSDPAFRDKYNEMQRERRRRHAMKAV